MDDRIETETFCPFCGSQAVGYSPYTSSCYCIGCHASSSPADSHRPHSGNMTRREVAIELWEQRV